MAELTNEEIRQKLLNLNYDCGPVTDTTREVLLKKLKSLNGKSITGKQHLAMTDEELRSQLISFGESVAPITSTNRSIYRKRLEVLKEKCKSAGDNEFNGWEPMEVD